MNPVFIEPVFLRRFLQKIQKWKCWVSEKEKLTEKSHLVLDHSFLQPLLPACPSLCYWVLFPKNGAQHFTPGSELGWLLSVHLVGFQEIFANFNCISILWPSCLRCGWEKSNREIAKSPNYFSKLSQWISRHLESWLIPHSRKDTHQASGWILN